MIRQSRGHLFRAEIDEERKGLLDWENKRRKESKSGA